MTQTLEEQAHIYRSNTNTIDIIHGTTSGDSRQGDREVAKPPSGTRGSRRLPKGKYQRR